MTTAKWMICRTPVRACGVRVCTGVLASVLLLVGVSPAIGQYDQGEAQAIEEALHEHGIASSVASADVVTAWNEQAHDIAFAEDSFLTFKGQRALAMTHMAMHDALNSIVPLYERYAYSGRPQIAHRWRRLRKPRTKWSSANTRISNRSSRPSSPSGSDGCRTARFAPLGRATAAAIVALRTGDGFDVPGTYEFRSGPGQYQTTPPWDGFVAQPGFRFAKPFVLASSVSSGRRLHLR